MSREIKFRCWDIEAKEMRHIITDLHWALHGLTGCKWMDSMTTEITHIENNETNLHGKVRFILMEYIGLKDKNGVEIYQGDRVKRNKAEYTVIDVPGGFSFEGENDRCNRHYYPNDFEVSENWEVIGNVYSNPTLLEKP